VSLVQPGFFEAFGVPLLTGRLLQRGDVASDDVAVVNEPFARTVFGTVNALGMRFRPVGASTWLEVVGVVRDFPGGRGSHKHAMHYRPLPADRAGAVLLAVRVRQADPLPFTSRLREIGYATDPLLRVESPRALGDTSSLEGSLDGVLFYGVVGVALSVLLLSAAGVYALMSFTIARRRREIGIRTALGAGARQVIAAVMSRAALQVGAGVALGLVLSTLALQGLTGWTWSAETLLVLPIVAVFMSVVGVAAAWGPAREALRIQPTEALRGE
jgi:ABC-type antimicrobial peptide transport system permease subunit